jgi:hypothetical protein
LIPSTTDTSSLQGTPLRSLDWTKSGLCLQRFPRTKLAPNPLRGGSEQKWFPRPSAVNPVLSSTKERFNSLPPATRLTPSNQSGRGSLTPRSFSSSARTTSPNFQAGAGLRIFPQQLNLWCLAGPAPANPRATPFPPLTGVSTFLPQRFVNGLRGAPRSGIWFPKPLNGLFCNTTFTGADPLTRNPLHSPSPELPQTKKRRISPSSTCAASPISPISS